MEAEAPPRKRRCLGRAEEEDEGGEEVPSTEADDGAIEEVLSDEELRPFTPRTNKHILKQNNHMNIIV